MSTYKDLNINTSFVNIGLEEFVYFRGKIADLPMD